MADERGFALLSSLGIVLVLIGLATSYAMISYRWSAYRGHEVSESRARIAAEEVVHAAIAELVDGNDAEGDGLGTVRLQRNGMEMLAARATDLGGNLYRITAAARGGASSHGLDVIVSLTSPGLVGGFPAAITSHSSVTTLGNIVVDGRDHDDTGTVVVGDGVPGISSSSFISNGGSSEVGGVGIAPGHPVDPRTVEQYATWGNGLDDDRDGVVDEEAFDGLDNDGDGLIDEDTVGFPTSPDVVFGVEPGSLHAVAQASGSYFTNQADFDNLVVANGGNVPGGMIVYLDFQELTPAHFGSELNDRPSILIHRSEDGPARMKNVHGEFKGVVMADQVQHLNGALRIVGAFMSFSDEANTYGNGSARILYSSGVLGALPGGSGLGNQVRVRSWKHVAPEGL